MAEHKLLDVSVTAVASPVISTKELVNDDVEFVSIRTRPEEVDPNAKPMIIVR